MADHVVAVTDLSVVDSGTRIVDEVSLVVEAGTVLALVGESGSGKSLTGRAIIGLLPDGLTPHGSIDLGGDEVVGASEDTLRGFRGTRAGMVFQEPQTALNPAQRIGTQLRMALRAHATVSRPDARRRAIDLLTEVGLPDPGTRIDWYPHQLSGGQKQRVVLALALAGEPRLIIADEPTTALDVTVQAEILDLFRTLCTRNGIGILLITHNMGVVSQIADRVAVMRAGRIVETGTAAAVLTHPSHPYTRQLLDAVLTVRADQPHEDTSPKPLVRVNDLTVRYPRQGQSAAFDALREVSVDIGRGEVLGVVGESGSGKTTLGRCVLGLVTPTSGTVTTTTDKVALIHQDPFTSLDPRWTVHRTITEPLRIRGVRDRAELRAKTAELLAAVRLPAEVADELPRTLSGGQRQRVALARALASDPELVIADEPTSALDVWVQASVLSVFTDLQKSRGFSAVFVSHDLAVISRVADRVAVLRGGRVIEIGSVSEVFDNPRDDYTRQLIDAVPTIGEGA
ncbi:dipeptide ABC transporter ATP-binding protein [Williamsia sterculiae]|uniref:Peptide/nickel transport system ATP-binding protein n=1 Tax=Williamsia sterculiae TaxID=1344003 RepID=A0A1N7HCX9_9NOCA|nr:ABC transporter ATP-binding protein [Williamsia sterculiae]SIS22737.1 peptide/nickel transport system ATP-binding protein [Williamsia sterculiae]